MIPEQFRFRRKWYPERKMMLDVSSIWSMRRKVSKHEIGLPPMLREKSSAFGCSSTVRPARNTVPACSTLSIILN